MQQPVLYDFTVFTVRAPINFNTKKKVLVVKAYNRLHKSVQSLAFFLILLGGEPRASQMQGKCAATEL